MNFLITQFKITGTVKTIEPLKVGLIHNTYIVTCKENQSITKYILQKVNTFVFKKPIEIMENIENIANHLEKNNYPLLVLKPIQAKTGKSYCVSEAGDFWRLFPFFDNTFSVNSTDNPEMAYHAAFAFGEYARYLKDFDIKKLHLTIPNFHNTPWRFESFEQAIKNAIPKRLKNAKRTINNLLEKQDILKNYPLFAQYVRPVHYDTKINNVLFDINTGKPKVIIDLDTVMPGLLPYDFGDMVRTYTPTFDENEPDIQKISIRKSILTAITEGYLEGIKDAINPIEKAHLPTGAALIIFEQAIRFLGDYLLGDVYYQVHYEEQNLIRAKNQVALLKSYLKTRNPNYAFRSLTDL